MKISFHTNLPFQMQDSHLCLVVSPKTKRALRRAHGVKVTPGQRKLQISSSFAAVDYSLAMASKYRTPIPAIIEVYVAAAAAAASHCLHAKRDTREAGEQKSLSETR